MLMRWPVASLVALLVSLMGCSDALGPLPDSLRLRTSESVYQPGDIVEISTDNNSPRTIAFGDCGELEGLDSDLGEWNFVWAWTCVGPGWTVKSRGERVHEYRLPGHLPPGTYHVKFEFSFRVEDDPSLQLVTQVTNAFEVLRAP